ncbi:MAG TPA: hypothetical protein VJM11_02545 [Nevskiaceae bacterium]|nr:hypothetical protein [Nevskiaceae bacterium]
MPILFRILAVMVLAASVLLGLRGLGVMRGTDDFGRAAECATAPHAERADDACATTSPQDRRTRAGVALLIAAGFGLGMGFALLLIAGRIGRVPPHRWFETPLRRDRDGDGDR